MVVSPGKYTAKIKDYGLGTTQNGDPKAMILFTFKDQNGQDRELTWTGSLKEGRAREITIDALLVCGLKGDELSTLASGVEGSALSADQEVQIDVMTEEYEGKAYSKIKWVNRLGGAAFREKMNHGMAVQKMAGLNLKADVAARRKETGVTDKKEDLPF